MKMKEIWLEAHSKFVGVDPTLQPKQNCHTLKIMHDYYTKTKYFSDRQKDRLAN